LPAILVGCASTNTEYPRASIFPYSTQQKMQAAEHWNILAANEAKLITEKLTGNPVIHISCVSSGCAKSSQYRSDFSEAYKEFLTSHLVNNGASVAIENERNSYSLEYHVQVVAHRDRGGLPAKVGQTTGDVAAIYGIYQAANNWTKPALALVPLAVGTDIYLHNRELTQTTNSEVLVTTKITKDNRVLVSNSNVYYFNAGDASHYLNRFSYDSKDLRVTNVN